MAERIAKAAFPSYNDESVPTSTHVRIRGLKAVPGEDGLFELQGIRPRIVDHEALAQALGYEAGGDPELEDKVLREVYRFDIMRVLTDRIVG
tara:strand:+ start:232 stop:507 length:276 start_codon:yes stop_codon:yes gene_type:complete